MSYATPQRYIQSYGMDEAVQFLADEQRLLTAELLLAALAEVPAWPESSTAEQQAAAADAADRMLRKLATTSSYMDGYLRSAGLALPLNLDSDVATTLEDCCLALTRGGLADDADNWTERMETVVDRWTAWLKDIASGKVKLSVPQPDNQPAAPTFRVKSGQAKSGFNWSRWGQ